MSSTTSASDAITRRLILGTAGHIDHGKTALVRALTGTDTDRLPEEKSRGITIDIGFADIQLGPYQLGIVDVPGHERFIKNMLAGAVGVDVAILVIAADDSVMPQTREHLSILELLGVKHGLIALTKCDLAEETWLEMVEEDVREFVSDTFLADAPIIQTSSPPGREPKGYDDLREAILQLCDTVAETPPSVIYRQPVDRTFTVQGKGTIITGTVWSGEINVGDEFEWLPAQQRLRVRSLQNHGKSVEHVEYGQRAAVNLIGVHHTEIERGNELVTPGFIEPSKLMTVELRVLENSPWPIRHRSRQRLYIGTQEIMIAVLLLSDSDAEPGSVVKAQLLCAEPTLAVAGQPFVIRAESPLVTIGGGSVLQPLARKIRRRANLTEQTLQRFDALLSNVATERAAAAIFHFGVTAWTDIQLCRDAQLEPSEVADVLKSLEGADQLIDVRVSAQRVIRMHVDAFADWQIRINEALKQLHTSSPLAAGFSRQDIATAMRSANDVALITAMIDVAIKRKTLAADDQLVALPGAAPQLSKKQRAMRDTIIDSYRTAGFKPPDSDKVVDAPIKEIRKMLELCVAQGKLVHLGSGFYLHSDAESSVRERVTGALAGSDGLTTSEIREALDTSRKYVIPIVEYLDRIGVTKRVGDKRVLVKSD